MKHKGFKLLAWMLVLTLLCSMMPFSAFATESDTPEETTAVEETEPTPSDAEAPATDDTSAAEPTEPDATSIEEAEEPQPTEESTEAPSLDEPISNEATAEKPTEAPSVDELLSDGMIAAGKNVTVYQWYDPRLDLKERDSSGFPYLTTCASDWVGEYPSSSKHGTLFYCLQYEVHGNGNQGTTTKATDLTRTSAWRYMFPDDPEKTYNAQKGITYALIYGAPYLSGYDNIYGYAATQLIVWEYQLGKRTKSTDSVSFFSATLGQSTTLKNAYNAILKKIYEHETMPSFNGQTVTLNGIGKEYGVKLTDTKGVLKSGNWHIESENPYVKIEQSGNTLTVYAVKQTDQTVTLRVFRNLACQTGTALCAKTGAQSCITGVPEDPSFISLNIKINAQVKATITKEVKGTSGSSTLRKKTFFVFEGWSNYQKWHDDTDPATCNQYVAAWLKTDENGACISSAQLQVGKNYYILEALDESNIVRYEENGETYVTDIFRRNANYPQMSVTGADAKTSGNVVKPMDGKMYVYGQMITFTPQSGSNIAIVCQNEIPSDGTAKKISESANVDGYRFKLYSYGSGKAVYGISDESGDIYITDENYTEVEEGKRTYTFDNFQDGVWRTDRWKFMAALETLTEQQFNEGLRPVSWRIRIGRKDGSTVFDKTYTYPEDIYADANNANTYRIEVFSEETENPFTGLDGGGSITMEITNEYPWKFQLVKRDATTNQNLPGAKFELTKGEESWDVTDNGDGTYSTKALPYGTYTLKETQAPDGYVLDEKEYTVTVDENGISCEGLTMENGMVVFPNSKPIGSVDILKQDSAGQPLDGVVFRLEVEENGQWQLVSDQTTVDGKAAWSELPIYQARQTEDGTVLDWITYRLTEIQTVDGNQLLGKPVFEGTFEDKLDEESQTYHLSYCVLNTPGFQMPPAGESGNLWLSVLGMCGMVACGGAMALLMRRKRWKPL